MLTLDKSLHLKLIVVVFNLYLVATWSSMAGMEIFGWLLFLLTMTFAARSLNSDELRLRDLGQHLPWRTMIAIYAITVIGIWLNGTPAADYKYAIGHPRWVLILLTVSYAWLLSPPSLKGYRLLLGFAAIVAVYAIVQSFTGIDLLRPGSERAVQRLPVDSMKLWRSAGLFGSPMGYVYIVGQHACLPLAVFLLFPKALGRWRMVSLAVFALMAVSLVTTYVRGAWIAMVVTYLVMTWFASRRFFYGAVGAGTAAFAALFVSLSAFRERFLSLFNANYTSNSDRWLLWKMNWEMWLDYPLLGIGWGENETRAREYMTRMGHPDAFTGHAHNNYLEALAGTGILGFTAFLFFIGFFLWLTLRLWKRLPEDLYWARALTLAALGAQLHVHIGGFTECNFKAGATSHNLMVVLGLVAAMSALEAKGLLRSRYQLKDTAS